MSGGVEHLRISPQHPAFAGHFPGQPIVPGVVLLDEALRALQTAGALPDGPVQLGAAKFLRPLRPGEPLLLRWRAPAASGAVAFTLETDGEAVASGSFSPAAGAGR